MNASIFREYDIRGIVGKDLSEDVVHRIGRAFATRQLRLGKKSAAVGRDVRESSGTFASALVRAFVESGLDVVDFGIVPTPVLYYGILMRRLDGGIMVTGSHNPVEYNGLKVCDGGLALSGDDVQELRRIAEGGEFAVGTGFSSTHDIMPTWRNDLLSRFKMMPRRRVVVDCGNGVAGPVAPALLRALGHEVIELYCDPDGRFPNHLPDPEVPEYMADLVDAVKSNRADIGFGFDGDGDRLGVIDENGRKISADWLIAIFARDLLERYPGGIVRFDVKCTDFLSEDVERHGGKPVMGRTGHSILKKDVKKLDAILGGELSGHIVFGREYYLIDDPFYCALKILQLMTEGSGRTCSRLFEGFPRTFSTAEIKAAVPDDKKFEIVAKLTEEFKADGRVIDVDGARVVFSDGWGLVRASNTTANLTIRFEARSIAALERIRELFVERLGRYPEIDLTNVMKVS